MLRLSPGETPGDCGRDARSPPAIQFPHQEVAMTRGAGKAPKQITWIICLVLYLVALLAHFGVFRVSADIAVWSWIIGFGLLLVAVRGRGL